MPDQPVYSIGSDKLPGLGKLIEETGELNQVLGKLIATGGEPKHWDGTNLCERLCDELADVMAAAQFFAQTNSQWDTDRFHARRLDKLETFQKWHTQHNNVPETKDAT